MKDNNSSIILNTSSNLLGFCLVVITSLHFSHFAEGHLIDVLTLVISLLLMGACLYSFLSLRSEDVVKARHFENRAGLFFFISIIGILGVMLMITIHFIE